MFYCHNVVTMHFNLKTMAAFPHPLPTDYCTSPQHFTAGQGGPRACKAPPPAPSCCAGQQHLPEHPHTLYVKPMQLLCCRLFSTPGRLPAGAQPRCSPSGRVWEARGNPHPEQPPAPPPGVPEGAERGISGPEPASPPRSRTP